MNNTVGEGISWLMEFSLLLLQAAISRNSLWKVESTILKTGQFSFISLFQECNFAFLVVRKHLISVAHILIAAL